MQHRDLPPLDLLVPFEASARLGSFTRAAEELSVTQSAVSQRVRTLEEVLGAALFLRRHRAIDLTEEGRELYNGVKVALQHLSSATWSVRRQDDLPKIRLAVDTSIAGLWLVPRLRPFLAGQPAQEIDLTVSDDPAVMLGADVVVLHGDGNWPGFEAWRLFPDEVFAVCAPDYLARCPLESVEDLCGADLIELDYKQWNWMNWGIWLTEAGVDPAGARAVIRTNDYRAKIDAARAGLGVALGWRHFVDADLAAGRLVQPVPDCVRTELGYYVALRHGARAEARALATHLRASVDMPGHSENYTEFSEQYF